VLFLLENVDVLKTFGQKHVNCMSGMRYGMTGKYFFTLPHSPPINKQINRWHIWGGKYADI
jgi:hypothetical protein